MDGGFGYIKLSGDLALGEAGGVEGLDLGFEGLAVGGWGWCGGRGGCGRFCVRSRCGLAGGRGRSF